MTKKTNQRKEQFQEGAYVPMTHFQRDFLNSRGKYVENKEMELIMKECEARKETTGKDFRFMGDLPWKMPMSSNETFALSEALGKSFTCKDSSCGTEGPANYELVVHEKREKQANPLHQELYGDKVTCFYHVEAKCKACGKHIQFVKYNKTNRRAAGDTWLNGAVKKEK